MPCALGLTGPSSCEKNMPSRSESDAGGPRRVEAAKPPFSTTSSSSFPPAPFAASSSDNRGRGASSPVLTSLRSAPSSAARSCSSMSPLLAHCSSWLSRAAEMPRICSRADSSHADGAASAESHEA